MSGQSVVVTADRIDYWIRRQVIAYCHRTHPSRSKLKPARDRGVWLIGQGLRSQYDVLADPVPAHLATLIKQLETQEQR